MKKRTVIFCSTLFFMNCSGEQKSVKDDVNTKVVEYGSEEWEQRRIEVADQMWELGKKKYPSSTLDLLPITKDTLIAATQYNGLILTTDAGKTWIEVESPGHIDELTLDNKGQLWGLKSWMGIHEADFCFLYLSDDFGESWSKFELDTKDIFPKNFYSQPNQPLRIIDYEGNVFQLKEVYPQLSWTLIDSVSERNDTSSIPPKRTTVVADSYGREWAFNREGIFHIGKDTTKVY